MTDPFCFHCVTEGFHPFCFHSFLNESKSFVRSLRGRGHSPPIRSNRLCMTVLLLIIRSKQGSYSFVQDKGLIHLLKAVVPFSP